MWKEWQILCLFFTCFSCEMKFAILLVFQNFSVYWDAVWLVQLYHIWLFIITIQRAGDYVCGQESGVEGSGNLYLCFRLGAHALCRSGEVTAQEEGKWGEEIGEEWGKRLISSLSSSKLYSSTVGSLQVLLFAGRAGVHHCLWKQVKPDLRPGTSWQSFGDSSPAAARHLLLYLINRSLGMFTSRLGKHHKC